MTFLKHELLGNPNFLKAVTFLGGTGLVAAMGLGANSNARSTGDIHCEGIIQEYVDPGTPVDQVVQDIATRLGINPSEYRTIFEQDNNGTDDTFAVDATNALVIGNGVINVAESCN